MVRAFTLQSIDLGFISVAKYYQKTLKMVFTASLPGFQHKRDSVEMKSARLLVVVLLGKTLNGMPPSLCSR